MNDMALINELMSDCKDRLTLKQMAFMLGRQRNPYTTTDDEITRIVSNEKLSEHYKSLARELSNYAELENNSIKIIYQSSC